MIVEDFYFYFKIGWDHIISADALDHQLFILALIAIYSFRNLKEILILVTAFTIGHSLTLALSVLDVVRVSSNWVEFLIPCTIFITAISNLFRTKLTKRAIRVNYYLALLFGLIHGLGFANTIRIMLAKDQSIGLGLFGFNVGLEIGQISVVLILIIVNYIIFTYTNIKRRDWIIFVSACVFAVALKMAIERIPFF